MISRFKMPVWLALTLPSILTIAAIWLPFGFSLTGLIEEWDVLGVFVTQGHFWITTPNTPLAAHALRPLTIFPHALAYFLGPDSFLSWHFILMLSLFVKGSACSYLIWKATGSLRFAMLMGVLVLVYPADTMQLSFRGLHINLAIAIVLFATSLMMYAYEQKKTFIAYIFTFLAAVLFFVGASMYEITLMMLPLPFLLLFARDGFRMSFRQIVDRLGLSLIWLAGGAAYLLYAFIMAKKMPNYYQEHVFAGGVISTLFHAVPKLFSIGGLRGVLGGWFDAIRMVLTEFNSYVYLAIMSALLWFTALNMPSTHEPSSNARWLPVRLAFVGFLSMLLCYAPFLLAPSHMAITQRTYLCAIPGAAMLWVAILMQIWCLSKPMTRLITFLMILCGLGAQLFQFNHYVILSDKQRTYLKNIVENFNAGSENKTLVLLDETNELGQVWMFMADGLRNTLTYVYGRPIAGVEICHMPSHEWQHPAAMVRNGLCIDTKDDWVFRYPSSVNGPGYTPPAVPDDLKISKNTAVTLVIHPDGSVNQNPALDEYRKSLMTSSDPVALRYRGFLLRENKPARFDLFEEQAKSNHYRWDFGDWWSLDLPIRGSGWRPAEWTVNNFYHEAQAWKTTVESALYFDLTPVPRPYVLRGKLNLIVSDSIKNSLQIRLNHHVLSYRWISASDFEADIPQGILKSTSNEIEFNTDVDSNYYGLSAALDYFEVTPLVNHAD